MTTAKNTRTVTNETFTRSQRLRIGDAQAYRPVDGRHRAQCRGSMA